MECCGMLKSPVVLVCCLLLALVPSLVYSRTLYTRYESEEFGHIRHENGTLEWGLFPTPISSSGREIQKRSSAWDTTVNFALAVVDSVQTRGFPYDLLRRIIQESYAEDEVLRYQTNVIVVTAVGGILAAAILLSVVIYLLVTWRRGHKDTFLLYIPQLNTFRAKVLVGVGVVVMAFDLVFLIWSLVASGHALTGALELDGVVNDAMDDVTNYFEGLQQHYEFITTKTSQWLIQDVMLSDLNEVGVLIWETGRDEFLPQVNGIFQMVADFDTQANQTFSLLSTLDTDMSSTVSGVGGEVDTVLTAVHYNLTAAVNDYTCFGCDGSCSGCSPIIPDDIFLNADFTSLPDISSNINDLQTLLSIPMNGSLQSPEYFFTYGLGAAITQNANVTTARNGLAQDLLSYGNTWGNASNNALYPNESTFWFHTLRPRWKSFHAEVEAKEIARFTFILIFCLLTIGTMGVTIYTVVMAGKRGLFRDLTGKQDFLLPRKQLGWCVIAQMTLASCHLAMSAAGFYTGANLEKAVCKPAESWGAVREVVDFPDAMPGHSDYFLSSVLLGNGTWGPITMADTLIACNNGSTAYSAFSYDLLMPDLQQDLQNYSQHVTGYEALFDLMRVNLDAVSLVPPDFRYWLGNFSLATDFNYTEFTSVLNGNVINADVDMYSANLLTIYNTPYPDGPLDPSKSRLPIASDLLLAQKTNISSLDQIKDNLAVVFAGFTSTVSSIQTTANQTIEDLLALDPALHAMAADAISRGVDQYKTEFLYLLDQAANQTWQWVGEAGACKQVREAYDSVVSGFCDNYADYQNASWLLLGHTCFFLLISASLSFVLYKGLPTQPDDEGFEELDSHTKARALFIEKKSRAEIEEPFPVIKVTSAEDEGSPSASSDDNHSERARADSRTTPRAVLVDVDSSDSDQSQNTNASYAEETLRRPSHGRVAALIGQRRTSNASRRPGSSQVAPVKSPWKF